MFNVDPFQFKTTSTIFQLSQTEVWGPFENVANLKKLHLRPVHFWSQIFNKIIFLLYDSKELIKLFHLPYQPLKLAYWLKSYGRPKMLEHLHLIFSQKTVILAAKLSQWT